MLSRNRRKIAVWFARAAEQDKPLPLIYVRVLAQPMHMLPLDLWQVCEIPHCSLKKLSGI
jgi:hypothetical protein